VIFGKFGIFTVPQPQKYYKKRNWETEMSFFNRIFFEAVMNLFYYLCRSGCLYKGLTNLKSLFINLIGFLSWQKQTLLC